MAATNGTILKLSMNGPGRAEALLPTFSSFLKMSNLRISRQDQHNEISGYSRWFVYGHGNGFPNRVSIVESAAMWDLVLTQVCRASHDTRPRGSTCRIQGLPLCEHRPQWAARWLRKGPIGVSPSMEDGFWAHKIGCRARCKGHRQNDPRDPHRAFNILWCLLESLAAWLTPLDLLLWNRESNRSTQRWHFVSEEV
jgi:hypothetical protein